MTVKRSCHWAEGTTQGDPIAVALFVLSVQVSTGGVHGKAELVPQ